MATLKKPPRLLHHNRRLSDDMIFLICKTAMALHLSKGEQSLLEFYSTCSSGFRPSQQYVADTTGLSRRHVAKVRQKLELNGLIKVTDDAVYVDWSRLRLFSTLDPSMTSKKGVVAPVSLEPKTEATAPADDFFLFAPLPDVCKYFSRMTARDFSKWKRNHREHPEKFRQSSAS